MSDSNIDHKHAATLQRLSLNDGAQLAYRYRPKPGRPVILLSCSIGTDMTLWQPQIAPLAEQFGVLQYDTRGHGQSSSLAGGYSIDRLVCDVLALMEHLSLEKVVFCGLSLGGMIGQALSYRHPERIHSLVLANTSAYAGGPLLWQDRMNKVATDGLASIWPTIVSRWFSADFIAHQSEQVEATKQMFLGTDTQGYLGCCAAIRDMDLRNLAQLNTVKTLLIAGQYDLATPPEHAEFLQSKARDARLVTLPAGHLSNIECPDQFVAAILDFVT